VLIHFSMVQVLTPVQAALLQVQVRPPHFWVSIKACCTDASTPVAQLAIALAAVLAAAAACFDPMHVFEVVASRPAGAHAPTPGNSCHMHASAPSDMRTAGFRQTGTRAFERIHVFFTKHAAIALQAHPAKADVMAMVEALAAEEGEPSLKALLAMGAAQPAGGTVLWKPSLHPAYFPHRSAGC